MPDDNSKAWLAEAAMHRILRRTLPAQRHEVLGALSALKLQLAVARRRAVLASTGTGAASDAGSADNADNADNAAARLAQLDAMAQQQLAAQTALTGLRLWDGHSAQRRPLAEVLSQSAAWVRQAAALRGHRLDEPLVAGEAQAHEIAVRVPVAHYLVLALLYEALDRLHEPSHLTPWLRGAQGGAWAIGLAAAPRGDGLPLPAATATPVAPVAPAGHGEAAAVVTGAMLVALAAHAASDDGTWQCRPGAAAGDCGHGDLVLHYQGRDRSRQPGPSDPG